MRKFADILLYAPRFDRMTKKAVERLVHKAYLGKTVLNFQTAVVPHVHIILDFQIHARFQFTIRKNELRVKKDDQGGTKRNNSEKTLEKLALTCKS